MAGTTVRPRATHDIDMIVVVEKMTTDFAEHFWQFIREGGYRPEKRKQEEGETPKYELYCFVNETGCHAFFRTHLAVCIVGV